MVIHPLANHSPAISPSSFRASGLIDSLDYLGRIYSMEFSQAAFVVATPAAFRD
ncbi:MAG: hypothetical protein ACI8Z5_002033 [Lentimonas sp.]|jgi:hypothetical protein